MAVVFLLAQVSAINDAVLIFNEKIAYSLPIGKGLILLMAYAGRQIGIAVQVFVQLLDAPFEAGQVGADDAQPGMLFQEVGAGFDLRFVGRRLGMQEHVIVGMVPELAAIVVYGHLLQRKPAVARFATMRHDGNLSRFQNLEYRVKTGIVDHDIMTGAVAQCHSDILPDFHG
jgi:hypothetical protein